MFDFKIFFISRWDNRWLNTVGSTQKTYSYQNFFGSRILCCLNTFLLLCTHQAQKLLNLSKRTPSKMRVSARAVRATIPKIIFHVQKYPKYLRFAYFYEKLKTCFSKPFWIQQISEKSAIFCIFEHFKAFSPKFQKNVTKSVTFLSFFDFLLSTHFWRLLNGMYSFKSSLR